MPSPLRPRSRPRLLLEVLEARSLPSVSGLWSIVGDQTPGAPNDSIVIQRNANDPKILEAVVNGVVASTHPLASLRTLRIDAGEGDDSVLINVGNRGGRFVVYAYGGNGNDTLVGSNGHDRLFGGPGNDVLDGFGGRDWLKGGSGDDRLHGGPGRDRLHGGAGHNVFSSEDRFDDIVFFGDQASFQQAHANALHETASPDALQDWIIQTSLSTWASWFGQAGSPIVKGGRGAGLPIFTADGVMLAASSSVPVSGTNTQEAGVDEADILKTDGQYLYTVVNGELLSIDARDPSNLAIAGRVQLEGSVDAFYLIGDRAVVLSHTWEYDEADDWPKPLPLESGVSRSAAAGLWWQPYYYRPQTIVTTIDLSDRTAPTIAHETTLDGYLVDSRAIAGQVYVVVENNLYIPRPLLLETAHGTVYESEAAYRARLESILSSALPGYSTTDYDGATATPGGGSLIDDAALYIPDVVKGQQLLSVTVFDAAADEPGPTAVTTIAGASGEVYASTNSLYVATTDYVSPWRDGGLTTQIYKFALSATAVPLDAIGAVKGTVLNQFSMDDEAGFFRIAVTTGWGMQASNAVYVMADTGADLEVVGSIENLAETERIYSVRFEGDIGYVVTFRQIDPLFTLDLSVPTSPQVVGELKIPGFSSYLQSVGDGLLIGLGRDADLNGRVRGLQLSLFDVADLTQPTQLDILSFSTEAWGGSSSAEWDHHAISYFADVGILTLPVSTGWHQPAKLEVVQISAAGLELLGAIAHDTPVLRSLRIGDLLFSMSSGAIQVHALTDPSLHIGSVELPPPADQQPPVVIRPPVVTFVV